MAVNCENGCPLDELGELKDALQQVHDIEPSETSLEELAGVDLVKTDNLIRLFLHHLDRWQLDCGECQSFPEKKADSIRKHCRFIERVLDLLEMIKPSKKKEGESHAVVKEGTQAA